MLRETNQSTMGKSVPQAVMKYGTSAAQAQGNTLLRVLWISLVVHVVFAVGVVVLKPMQQHKRTIPVTIKITKTETPKVEEADIAPKPIPPPPRKPEPKKVVSERKPVEQPKEAAKPVQGLSASAVDPNGKGIAAPVGNTLLVADDGTRMNPGDVKALSGDDMSADAKLLGGSVAVPKYTEDAIDASLEGYFIVDAFVDALGKVLQVELRKKVGFGMDQRILTAAKSASFIPRKDRYGRSVAGWTEIKFRLEIPN